MKRVGAGRLLAVPLDAACRIPLHRQIYNDVRERILSGALRAGTLLPSSRALAGDLHVARSTVVQAYEELRAEGYLESERGGTRVSDVASDIPTSGPATTRGDRLPPPPKRLPELPSDAMRLRSALTIGPRAPRAFRAAVPAVDAFPIALWTQTVNRVLRRAPGKQLAYGDPLGFMPLREAIADYLTVSRGVRCSATQIVVVNGSQHALTLCASALVAPGDEVWIEDPFYVGSRAAFELARATLVPIGVDDEGMCVSEGIRRAPNARAAFVTPSRQLPLGVTMSVARRLELLDWARRSGSWIIEDDYDSEFRYASRPITALQGLDDAGSVIYVGTFSKVMFPSLRLAYMVVPDSLLDRMHTVRFFSDFHTEYLNQAAMAEFIRQGHFERHVRRMRTTYAERANLLATALRERLGGRLDIPVPTAGLTLVTGLRDDDDAVAIARESTEAGIELVPVSAFTVEHRVRPMLLFGFGGLAPREIREGVDAFAKILERYDAKQLKAQDDPERRHPAR
jgi:GntR family transcriptional regulator/MocR family aminotransferase